MGINLLCEHGLRLNSVQTISIKVLMQYVFAMFLEGWFNSPGQLGLHFLVVIPSST